MGTSQIPTEKATARHTPTRPDTETTSGRSDKTQGKPNQGENESAAVQKKECFESVHAVHSTVGAVLKPSRTE
ncbi:hypothetical protein G9444_3772 [Rhodococcus erythropolis]|uniref:Uncharacterized protein n=1 Tax=Rhodococcus erythropolis TaxID=1833 RepID=A0A6G9CWD1_RHOER|nr:hypothetical protein G9444_3772 [Rhodococcus erythropolis]